jgi:hypothetical protein
LSSPKERRLRLHHLKQFAIYESRIDGISGITTFFYKPTEKTLAMDLGERMFFLMNSV